VKHNNQVRRPELANSAILTDKNSAMSIGDTLRKAKKDLFFSRCLIAILIVLLITTAAVLIYLGYAQLLFNYVSNAVN
jgi:hypothetical protein